MIRVLLCLLLFLLAPFTVAEPVPGKDDRRFQNAVQLWLSGADDLAALKQFAVLAHADNVAAQITLGLITRTPHYDAAVDGMSRQDQRRRLAPKRLISARQWMRVWPLHIALESPYAPMIATEDWHASSRFRGDILRSFNINESWKPYFDQHATCFIDALRQVQ
jgi:hypothetical protein